jgi:hypothetical protein
VAAVPSGFSLTSWEILGCRWTRRSQSSEMWRRVAWYKVTNASIRLHEGETIWMHIPSQRPCRFWAWNLFMAWAVLTSLGVRKRIVESVWTRIANYDFPVDCSE